jgi:uncharacterized protein DUF3943
MGISTNMNTQAAIWFLLATIAHSAWGTTYNDHVVIKRVAERHGFSQLLVSADADSDTTPTDSVLLNKPFTQKNKKGLKRDTQYFLAYQIAVIAVLYVMPEDFSGWSDDQKSQRRVQIWWDNVTHPEWDEDDLFINYALHPYWGATYFVRAKERGYSNREALYYSALLSTLYEFGVEAIFENPSIQDFFVTPFAGYYLGKYFLKVRQDIRHKVQKTGRITVRDKLVLALTDPLGSMNRYVDRKLGKDAQLNLQLLTLTGNSRSDLRSPIYGHQNPGIAVRFTLRY